MGRSVRIERQPAVQCGVVAIAQHRAGGDPETREFSLVVKINVAGGLIQFHNIGACRKEFIAYVKIERNRKKHGDRSRFRNRGDKQNQETQSRCRESSFERHICSFWKTPYFFRSVAAAASVSLRGGTGEMGSDA